MGYNSFYNRYAKRVIGLLLALMLLPLMLPVYVIVAVAIIADTGWPVLYRPQRGGYHNRPFRICKFRTMVKDADKVGRGTTALNDPRITRVGNVLRKTKLDETPQLMNIIAGTMSFIGPRPEVLRYTRQYTGDECLIYEVRPGITDFSSIEFINLDEIVGAENVDDIYETRILPRKNVLRVRYAREVSFATDARLFLLTVYDVIKKATRFIFMIRWNTSH